MRWQLLGLAIGVFFAAALVAALADEDINRLDISYTALAVLAGLAGVLAAVVPAGRAASSTCSGPS